MKDLPIYLDISWRHFIDRDEFEYDWSRLKAFARKRKRETIYDIRARSGAPSKSFSIRSATTDVRRTGRTFYDQRIFLDADSAEAPAAEIDLELLHGRRYLEVG